MAWFIIEGGSDGQLRLSPELSHHLCGVLRLQSGELIKLFSRTASLELTCRIDGADSRTAHVTVISSRVVESSPITLCLGIPEVQILESVMEKVSELGIKRTLLFPAQRTQKHNVERARSKLERLSKLVEKGSEVAEVPPFGIEFASSFDDLLKKVGQRGRGYVFLSPGDAGLLAVSAGSTPHYVEHFLRPNPAGSPKNERESRDTLSLEKSSQDADLYLIIGPEGGLVGEETLKAVRLGWNPVTLGSSTLRVETAALLACAAARELHS